MINIFPAFIIMAIVLVIILTELIKKLDKKNKMKGYRVWIPMVLSAGASALLLLGNFFNPPGQFWFWWAVIFALSVFGFEAILKKIKAALGDE